MFDLNQFIGKCQSAISQPNSKEKIQKFLIEEISNFSDFRQTLLGLRPQELINDAILFRSTNLLIFNSFLLPNLLSPPHNHGTWVVMGSYEGHEDNIFYEKQNGTLEEQDRKRLTPGEVVLLEPDAIHAVSNPSHTPSLALHIYGTDLFSAPRSMWNPWTLEESPFELGQFLMHSEEMMEDARSS